MKRFILGTVFGVFGVAVLVTFIPDKAHQLVDQAGDVRVLIEDVAARLDRLEGRSAVEVSASAEDGHFTVSEFRISDEATVGLQAVGLDRVVPVERSPEDRVPTSPRDGSVQKQSIDFDNLATGLAKVTGALEKLNRTMKPGNRKNRENGSGSEDKVRSGS